jgi:glycosyltransferase involved in cell wall biosynthesis
MRIAIYCHSVAPSIDGVCRRFAGILREFIRQKHEVILFTLEEQPEELPEGLIDVISLNWMIAPAYPGKKIAKTSLSSLFKIYFAMRKHRPDIIHVTSDGLSHSFALIGLILKIPVVGSFHTDIIDLLTTHNANFIQKLLVLAKENMDSFVLDSCATTSISFAVTIKYIIF